MFIEVIIMINRGSLGADGVKLAGEWWAIINRLFELGKTHNEYISSCKKP
jgi:hypothetical protein